MTCSKIFSKSLFGGHVYLLWKQLPLMSNNYPGGSCDRWMPHSIVTIAHNIVEVKESLLSAESLYNLLIVYKGVGELVRSVCYAGASGNAFSHYQPRSWTTPV